MATGSESEILTEIPEELKRLVRFIIRGFYGVEHSIVIDLLCHYPCIKEDDLIDFIRFERKHLRTLMNTLKTDKFVKMTLRVETDAEGRMTRHNYYFINYSVFVNVVKYKLDQMRRKIEVEERDSTSRSSFKCPGCNITYTDLDAGKLLDPVTMELMCTYCHTQVEMEESSTPQVDARMLMARFNEQMAPLFDLLGRVEDLKLAPELLEPEPVDIKALRSHTGGSKPSGERGWRENARDYSYGMQKNQITINMEEDGKSTVEKAPVKEQPKWMKESTVDGAIPEPKPEADKSMLLSAAAGAGGPRVDYNDEVMAALLAHEKKGPTNIPTPIAIPGAASDNESSTSESEDEAVKAIAGPSMHMAGGDVEEMESDNEDEVMVMVAGRQVPFHEAQEMVDQMTLAEKEAYIKLGQEMYQHMYDD